MKWFRAIAVLGLLLAGCEAGSPASSAPSSSLPAQTVGTTTTSPMVLTEIQAAETAVQLPRALELAGLRNVVQVADSLYCGSQPLTHEAFDALRQLGVRTIICIDGVTPLEKLAEKAGLAYVHLPCGFGNAADVAPRLQSALASLRGPFYVHCRNGRPRTPALVSMVARSTAGWTDAQVATFLDANGVSDTYPTLRQTALEYKPKVVAPASPDEFPSRAELSPVVSAMATLLADWDPLTAASAAGFVGPGTPSALDLAEHAGRSAKVFEDLAAEPATAEWGADFVAQLKACAQAFRAFEAELRAPDFDAQRDAAITRLKSLGARCGACHKEYRN